MNATNPPKEQTGFDIRDLPDELIYVGLGFLAAGGFVLQLVLRRHPFLGAALMAAVVALGYVTMRVRAGWLDRRAARLDPPSPGVIVGTVKGDWKLARPRPFRVPWSAFHQHVLVAGPTGRGKTFTFIQPILRGLCSRRQPTGDLYVDGKGDRVDKDPAIAFDFVFCPEDPQASSYWNPLAGRALSRRRRSSPRRCSRARRRTRPTSTRRGRSTRSPRSLPRWRSPATA